MALVRVYCGVATAELAPWLTVAVVDDAGRLLDMRHISDDPAGYAYLISLLSERSGAGCPVAVDRHEHIVAQLLAAANRPVAVADELSLLDFADRFADDSSYEEMQAPPSQRRAIGLARALQAGTLYATAQSPSWDLDDVKPLLSAHAALVVGRQAAAVALRDVLRELYPAALRAYLDPAEHIPLRILEAFPDPAMALSPQGHDAVVAELANSGLTDPATAVSAVNALRSAIEESRGWNGGRLAPAVAETVRQAVAAVRACDAATTALVGSLVERLSTIAVPRAHPSAAPVSPAVPRRSDAPPYATPAFESQAAPAFAGAAPALAGAAAGFAGAAGFADAGAGFADTPPAFADPAGLAAAVDQAAFAGGGYATPQVTRPNGAPGGTYRGGGWEERFGPAPGDAPARGADTASRAPGGPREQAYGPDTLSFSMDPLTAPLDPTATGAGGPAAAVSPAEPDEDLRIFSEAEANSVWFTSSEDDTQVTWTNLASDDGWRAAEQSSAPSMGPETGAGLPRRVPQANLVPGSATAPARMPRVTRDPRSIATHTDSYFRGWRRGQEVGGFAVGQRDRGAWEFNRELRAKQGAARLS